MFIAVKDQIGLEIDCAKEALSVIPFCIDNSLMEKATSIAHEEADQAIHFLKDQQGRNDELSLRTYFEEKGWKITSC